MSTTFLSLFCCLATNAACTPTIPPPRIARSYLNLLGSSANTCEDEGYDETVQLCDRGHTKASVPNTRREEHKTTCLKEEAIFNS